MTENTSATPSGNPKNFQYLNLILHGAFGYIFDDDAIRVFTPACFGHFYAAGGLNSLENICKGVDYSLVGVKTPSTPCRTIFPGGNSDPIISQKDVQLNRSDIDSFNIRYSMFELPYPTVRTERPCLMNSALHEFVGEIYSGHPRAANPLNALEMVPSMHILVYEIANQQNCGLSPKNPPNSSCSFIRADEASTSDPDATINFHIFCSKSPMDMRGMSGMTDDGHIRRAFAGVVGLLGGLELCLNFPNRFQPASPADPPPLPIGVTQGDLEPAAMRFRDQGGQNMKPMFGHVNCQYSDLLLIP